MNLQLQPRTDLVLPHPHSICALRDTHTLHPRLSTRSNDLTKLIGGHQLPGHLLSERHKNHISRGYHQPNPIQRP
jgi:hypothetical protein